MVRTPSSRLGLATLPMARWNLGANRNPMFTLLTHVSTSLGLRSILTPSCSSKSALPHLLDTDRLPCLKTGMPAAAATMATVVEMLNVLAPSPPVPQVSMAYRSSMLTAIALSRITRAPPDISALLSPLMRRPINSAPTCVGVNSPSMILVMTWIISTSVRSSLFANLLSTSGNTASTSDQL